MLEAMINEYYEWLSEYSRLAFRMDLVRRYGASSDVREQVEALSQNSLEAKAYSDACEGRVLAVSEKPSVEEARELLTQLKSVLNTYAERLSEDFVASLPTDEEDSLESVGLALLPNSLKLDIKDIW